MFKHVEDALNPLSWWLQRLRTLRLRSCTVLFSSWKWKYLTALWTLNSMINLKLTVRALFLYFLHLFFIIQLELWWWLRKSTAPWWIQEMGNLLDLWWAVLELFWWPLRWENLLLSSTRYLITLAMYCCKLKMLFLPDWGLFSVEAARFEAVEHGVEAIWQYEFDFSIQFLTFMRKGCNMCFGIQACKTLNVFKMV